MILFIVSLYNVHYTVDGSNTIGEQQEKEKDKIELLKEGTSTIVQCFVGGSKALTG